MDSVMQQSQVLESPLPDVHADLFADKILETIFSAEHVPQVIKVLKDLTTKGAIIFVGGRTVRESMGFGTLDLAGDIVDDAKVILSPHDKIRLGPLVPILEEFPEERMVLPDLDFFVIHADLERFAEAFESIGYGSIIKVATGGVKVLDIKGDYGSATFVDFQHSWQTGPMWPQLAMFAQFKSEPVALFQLDEYSIRMFDYPLLIPNVSQNPVDRVRLAAVGRALVWLNTVSTPDGWIIAAPYEQIEVFMQTVAYFYAVARDAARDALAMKSLGSAGRDMALGLRNILLTDCVGEFNMIMVGLEANENMTTQERESRIAFFERRLAFMEAMQFAWRAGKEITPTELKRICDNGGLLNHAISIATRIRQSLQE